MCRVENSSLIISVRYSEVIKEFFYSKLITFLNQQSDFNCWHFIFVNFFFQKQQRIKIIFYQIFRKIHFFFNRLRWNAIFFLFLILSQSRLKFQRFKISRLLFFYFSLSDFLNIQDFCHDELKSLKKSY